MRSTDIVWRNLNRVVSGFNVIPAPHGAGGKSSTRERRATWDTEDDRRQCHDLTWSISRWCRRWAWTRIYEVLKRQSGELRLRCLVIRQQEYMEIQSRYTLFDCVHYPRQLKSWCIQKDSNGSQILMCCLWVFLIDREFWRRNYKISPLCQMYLWFFIGREENYITVL